MTLNKEMVIDILEKALANPRYLGEFHNSTCFFCSSVAMVILEGKEIPFNDADEITQHIQDKYIYPSINECLFLKTHLANTGIIEYCTLRDEPVYKIAARNHWATLIQSLKDSEQ